jgi:salicylate hydroxylase
MTRIIIVGAGIGGLAATVALEQAGFEVCTIERASQFGEVGAGVQLGPNASRVLIHLGLEGQIRSLGVPATQVNWLRWQDGKALATMPLTEMEGMFGAPYLTMYRPDLIDVLASKVSTAQVRLGVTVSAVTESAGRPAVELSDGTVEAGDLVVGADGIHSGVRAQTVGDAAPRFSGMSAYRARVSRDELDFDDAVRNWMGPDRHLVAYPVGTGSKYLNIVAVVPDQEPTAESWTMPGSADELRRQFDGWCDPVQSILGPVRDPVYRWALYDRDPLPRWSTATTTLLGDAAHPMLPFFAQGAAQAIGDAAALTQALSEAPDDLPSALKKYERARLDHTARIQRLSWDNNVVYHMPDGPEQRERDAFLAGSSAIDTFSWLYGNDPFALTD